MVIEGDCQFERSSLAAVHETFFFTQDLIFSFPPTIALFQLVNP